MKRFFIISIVVLSIVACGCSNIDKSNNSTTKVTSSEKQLNISILLDLSDRINPKINPDAQKNDIENIKTITEFFKSNMDDLGAYKSKGKIQIFFSPSPANSDINSFISKLKIDCSKMDNRGRKNVYDSITQLYVQNSELIYKQTLATSDWAGSDIWRFFKVDVKDFCIDRDTNYRNILIIFTDGYLFHEQSKFNLKNRYPYLLSSNLSQYRNQNWQYLIEKDDFGILTERKDLNDLEVLVLEIKARNASHKIDEDILRFLWEKWFKEMNVTHYAAYPSNEPSNTKTRIENFLTQK